MYSEICAVLAELMIGVIIDTFGRKSILIIGQLVSAASIGAIPLFKEVYPGYLICRLSCAVGTIIAFIIPLVPDYVKHESIGLASAYIAIVSAISSILSGTILY